MKRSVPLALALILLLNLVQPMDSYPANGTKREPSAPAADRRREARMTWAGRGLPMNILYYNMGKPRAQHATAAASASKKTERCADAPTAAAARRWNPSSIIRVMHPFFRTS